MTSPTTPRTILGTDYILEALAAEGLGHLFMVPGGLVDPFLPALARQKKLKPVIAAHEGGAVYMADGYARASGSFGAALGIGGPGCCNMATAVAAAKTDGSPVLVMTGEVPLDLEDRGAFQDASQATLDDTAVMAPLTRLSKTVASAKNLNHWFRHALTTMWAQPRGPVHLSLTHDALVGESAADYVAVSGFFAHVAAEHGGRRNGAAAARGSSGRKEPHRHSRRRRRRARRGRGAPQGDRRALVHPGRDHAARQRRVPGGPCAVTRRLRLCRQPTCHRRHPRRRARLPPRPRLRLQRARHHALDRARTFQGFHDPCEHRHGGAHRPRRPGSRGAGERSRLPRPHARARRRHRARARGG